MLTLKAKTWYIRLYYLGEDIWDAFMGNPPDWYLKRTTVDLCQLIRMIFVQLPIAVGSNILLWVFVGWSLFVFPLTTGGFVPFLLFWLYFAIVAGICISSIYGLIKFFESRHERKRRQGIVTDPSLLSLIGTRISSWHDKFCVMIKIDNA